MDENPQTAARYNVLSIPMVVLFDGPGGRDTVVGARPRSHYEGAWEQCLAPRGRPARVGTARALRRRLSSAALPPGVPAGVRRVPTEPTGSRPVHEPAHVRHRPAQFRAEFLDELHRAVVGPPPRVGARVEKRYGRAGVRRSGTDLVGPRRGARPVARGRRWPRLPSRGPKC